MENVKCYVLHVKHGYEDRKTHIEKELAKKDIVFEYVLDGDISDLTQERLDRYFSGRMYDKIGITSCAMKHILIYEDMIKNNIPKALVIEDDIFLKRNFREVFRRSVEDTYAKHADKQPYYIGYESTWTRLIPRSERKKNKGVIYPAKHLQCTGTYLVNRAFAIAVLDYIYKNKCDMPIDDFLTSLSDKKKYSLYWSYPVIAEQGSHNGKMSSSLGSTEGRSYKKMLSRRFTNIYKEILYFFR